MKNMCSVDGCQNLFKARGLCNKHWVRWRKGTSLTKKSVFEKTPTEKFWEYVDKRSNDECWLWTGSTRGNDRFRYGMIWINGKHESAHRFSWILHNGQIPRIKDADYRGTCILHKCDNPLCVNPKHLFLGTHTENMQDKAAKGRSRKKTICHAGHEYSVKNTYISKRGARHCRECHRIREAIRYARLRAGG